MPLEVGLKWKYGSPFTDRKIEEICHKNREKSGARLKTMLKRW